VRDDRDDPAVVYQRRAGVAPAYVDVELVVVSEHAGRGAAGCLLGLRFGTGAVHAIAPHGDGLVVAGKAFGDGAKLPVAVVGKLAQAVGAGNQHRPVVAYAGVHELDLEDRELVGVVERAVRVGGGNVELDDHGLLNAVAGGDQAARRVPHRGRAPNGQQTARPQLIGEPALVDTADAAHTGSVEGLDAGARDRDVCERHPVAGRPRPCDKFHDDRVAVEVGRRAAPLGERRGIELLYFAIGR
jgi:hypothetical protein